MSADLRRQFEYHDNTAQFLVRQHLINAPIEIVVRKYPGQRAGTSLIGRAITRAIYDRWNRNGVRYRIVKIYQPIGKMA